MWKLVYRNSRAEISPGATLRCRNEAYTVCDPVGHPPRHASSSGRVFVKPYGEDENYTREYFPHVFDLEWIEI